MFAWLPVGVTIHALEIRTARPSSWKNPFGGGRSAQQQQQQQQQQYVRFELPSFGRRRVGWVDTLDGAGELQLLPTLGAGSAQGDDYDSSNASELLLPPVAAEVPGKITVVEIVAPPLSEQLLRAHTEATELERCIRNDEFDLAETKKVS